MSNLPKYYFGDIAAEVMAEIADAMQKNDWTDFSIADCESRNHKEHRGELWQCAECLRLFCCIFLMISTSGLESTKRFPHLPQGPAAASLNGEL